MVAEIALERELAIWADALAFDHENGEDGPEVIERRIAELRAKPTIRNPPRSGARMPAERMAAFRIVRGRTEWQQ